MYLLLIVITAMFKNNVIIGAISGPILLVWQETGAKQIIFSFIPILVLKWKKVSFEKISEFQDMVLSHLDEFGFFRKQFLPHPNPEKF